MPLNSSDQTNYSVDLCSGVGWPAPWQLPAVMMQCECLRRMRQPIQTSRCSRWLLRRPKLTTRMSTVSPGTQKKRDSWLPAATMEISPSGGSKKKTECVTSAASFSLNKSAFLFASHNGNNVLIINIDLQESACYGAIPHVCFYTDFTASAHHVC